MKITLIQNAIGRFNLFGTEESLVFILGISDENGKVIEENGIRARLYYSGEPDNRYELEGLWGDMDIGGIFKKCFEYANRVISSCNYQSECLLFAKLYSENHSEIERNFLEDRNEKIKKQIAQLESDSNSTPRYLECEYFISDFNSGIEDEIEKYKRWVETCGEKLAQLKPDSDLAKEESERKQKYQDRIDFLKLQILTPTK